MTTNEQIAAGLLALHAEMSSTMSRISKLENAVDGFVGIEAVQIQRDYLMHELRVFRARVSELFDLTLKDQADSATGGAK